MKQFNIKEQVDLAVSYFEAGHNCAQSVFLAYSEILGIDINIAKKMTVSFGGGIGRMRETCGAVNAIAMLVGFKYPVHNATDQKARTLNYQITQKAVNLFKTNHGSIMCHDLLDSISEATDKSPIPSLRTEEYYAKRPCLRLVRDSAEIAGKMLQGELEEGI